MTKKTKETKETKPKIQTLPGIEEEKLVDGIKDNIDDLRRIVDDTARREAAEDLVEYIQLVYL